MHLRTLRPRREHVSNVAPSVRQQQRDGGHWARLRLCAHLPPGWRYRFVAQLIRDYFYASVQSLPTFC